jgi:hypothetical protein
MPKLLLCCACLLVACTLLAVEADALTALPELPRPRLQTGATPPFDPPAGTALAPWVRLVPGSRVVLDGTVLVDRGPSDGLEVFACLREGKTHESFIRLNGDTGDVIKAAGIAALGLSDGRPAEENRGIPARGTPLRLTVLWKDEDGVWRWSDAACLVRDRRTDRAYPPLPWLWTGSRMQLIAEAGVGGKVVSRERFMLDSTRSLAVNYDEPDALLASPFPNANEDQRFEVNSSIAPPVGTLLHLALSPAETVLQLRLLPDGRIERDGTALDLPALTSALAAAFSVAATPPHRAVFVRTANGVGDDLVVAARARILAAAAAGKAWTVPLFVPE